MRIDALGGIGVWQGSGWRRLRGVLLLWVLIWPGVYCSAEGASAQSDAVEDAIAYLVGHRNTDGTWSSGERRLVDTVEAIKALSPYIGQNQDANQAANGSLDYVIGIGAKSNDELARKLGILGCTAYDTGPLRAMMLAAQNADGGWGVSAGKQSSVVDTMIAVDALLKDGYTGGEVAAARGYLLEQQSEVGCWVLADEADMPGDTARAAIGLIVLKDLEKEGFGNSELRSAAAKAQGYLEQVSESSDIGQLSTADIALVYRALLRMKQPYDVRDLLTELFRRRLGDGSWQDDIFVTALGLEALTALSPPWQEARADLAVYGDYIWFEPSSPSTGQEVVITASITNEGTADAWNFYVEFYNGDPNGGGQLIGSACYISGIAAGSRMTSGFAGHTD